MHRQVEPSPRKSCLLIDTAGSGHCGPPVVKWRLACTLLESTASLWPSHRRPTPAPAPRHCQPSCHPIQWVNWCTEVGSTCYRMFATSWCRPLHLTTACAGNLNSSFIPLLSTELTSQSLQWLSSRSHQLLTKGKGSTHHAAEHNCTI